MRLQQLALRVHCGEQRLRFHDRLTVISGIGIQDRLGLVEVVLGTLAGTPTISSELAYVDRAGRRVKVDQTGEGAFHHFYDDGAPASGPAAVLGLSLEEIFALTYVSADDLGLGGRHRPAEPAELSEARAVLAALTDELHAAQVARSAAQALRFELNSLDERLRQVDAGRPKRRYARLLLQLEALKSERAALSAGPAEADADRRLAARWAELRPFAQRWREAVRRVDRERRRFGDRTRLDDHVLAGAMAVPNRVPPSLQARVDALAAAESCQERVSAELAAMMAAHVPSPSHPDVARLARGDQDEVWAAARRALETSLRLEQASLAVGGLAVDGIAPPIVAELESAHGAVEQAREALEKRRFGVLAAGGAAALGAMALPLAPMVAPLALAGAASAAYWAVLSPRQQLAEAETWEDDTLSRVGVPSYLAFHLRRVEAMHDPSLRGDLDHAARDHRRSMQDWRRLAGDLSPAEALALEAEVEAYRGKVAALGQVPPAVAETRRHLTEEVEPAVEQAREALLELCRPFGIESPTLAVDLVRQLADVAAVARHQSDLEAAEADEREARHALEEHLAADASSGGDLGSRLAAFEARAGSAQDRTLFRSHARSLAEVDHDLARLTELSRSEYRPEFGTVLTAADAVEPDPEELLSRRHMTATACTTATRILPDVARIADRRSAVERRVAFLEQQAGEVEAPSPVQQAEIESYLYDRLARLGHCGSGGESLPLLLDECFAALRADAKWAMFDLADRLSALGQVVYLTDDPDAAAWARRRAAGGTVGFLDPIGGAAP